MWRGVGGCGGVWKGVGVGEQMRGRALGRKGREGWEERVGWVGGVGGGTTMVCMCSHQGAPPIYIHIYLRTAASSGKQAHARCTMVATKP